MNLENFFDDVIKQAKELLPNDEIWYRGHAEEAYQLTPTIYRGERSLNEVGIFYDYKTNASAINGAKKDDWDILLDMQHYGLPTRLLDWTTSLGTALYFALKDPGNAPCIWLLDPYRLSDFSTDDEIIYDTSTMNLSNVDYYKDFVLGNLLDENTKLLHPFSIQPPHTNDRISVQRGRFTVHTKSKQPIEEQCPDAVRKILIPEDLIKPLKKYLSLLGIDAFSQFPDQYGLSEYLKTQYGIK